MNGEREIPTKKLKQMADLVDPAVTIRDADLASTGHQSVYHLDIEREGRRQEWVLKAARDESSEDIATEARLLTIVSEWTSMPVPAVIGVVDAHEKLPTPYFVMERTPGTNLPKRAIAELSDDALARIAFESGRYLAELHALDGPSGYGRVTVAVTSQHTGGRPSVSLDQLGVAVLQGASSSDPREWPAVFRTWCDDTLDRLASTRFGDLRREVGPVVDTLVDDFSGPYESVIARVDHGLNNILVDPETGRITGVIDWAFTLSVPPAYDLACLEANLAMDPWSVHPSTPDRRELVREKLREGYRLKQGAEIDEQLDRNHSVYMLIAILRAMNHLDAMPEFVMDGANEADVDVAAKAYRRLVSTWLS